VRTLRDDSGAAIRVPDVAERIVSLVPCLTEAVAVSAPGRLVGATDWCTHPGDLDVARVRGTKNPDVAAVVALRPDLVLANAEENREADLEALRAAGIAVWVGVIRTVDEAVGSLARMLDAAGIPRPAWLDQAAAVWAPAADGPRVRAAVPIWRRPWMVAGADTFAADMLARLGVDNVFDDPPADAAGRYPKAGVEEIRARGATLVVLPDEPYAFSATDGPEAFPGLDVALVSGRHLTWYGPSLVEARAVLTAQLAGRRQW
jgi:ABC-type Fe3+-hydroxamate transport system substrate-binding protein